MILVLTRRYLTQPVVAAAGLLALLASVVLVKAPRSAAFDAFPYFFVMFAAMPRGALAFDASLPIRKRDIAAAQILSTLAFLLFPLLVAILYVPNGTTRELPISVLLEGAAILSLGLLLPYTVRRGEIEDPPLWVSGLVWAALAATSFVVLRTLPPIAGLLTLVAVVVGTSVYVWEGIPDAIEFPRQRVLELPPMPAAMGGVMRATRSVVPLRWLPILRSIYSPSVLIIYAAIALMGIASSTIWLFYILIFASLVLPRGARWLNALPLAPRAKLRWLLVVFVLLPVALIGGERLLAACFLELPAHDARAIPRPSRGQSDFNDPAGVPLEYWRLGARHALPMIAAPWGETTAADTITVFGVTLFDPYTRGDENSWRFNEWQYARASTAIFGHIIPLAPRWTQISETPSRERLPRMRLLCYAATAMILLFAGWLRELQRWHRFGRSRASRWVGNAVMLVPWYAFLIAWLYYTVTRDVDVFVQLSKKLLWHLSNQLPANLLAVAVIVTLPILAMYALLEWQFTRSEFVPSARTTK